MIPQRLTCYRIPLRCACVHCLRWRQCAPDAHRTGILSLLCSLNRKRIERRFGVVDIARRAQRFMAGNGPRNAACNATDRRRDYPPPSASAPPWRSILSRAVLLLSLCLNCIRSGCYVAVGGRQGGWRGGGELDVENAIARTLNSRRRQSCGVSRCSNSRCPRPLRRELRRRRAR